jgi:hypothetical protein
MLEMQVSHFRSYNRCFVTMESEMAKRPEEQFTPEIELGSVTVVHFSIRVYNCNGSYIVL